ADGYRAEIQAQRRHRQLGWRHPNTQNQLGAGPAVAGEDESAAGVARPDGTEPDGDQSTLSGRNAVGSSALDGEGRICGDGAGESRIARVGDLKSPRLGLADGGRSKV